MSAHVVLQPSGGDHFWTIRDGIPADDFTSLLEAAATPSLQENFPDGRQHQCKACLWAVAKAAYQELGLEVLTVYSKGLAPECAECG